MKDMWWWGWGGAGGGRRVMSVWGQGPAHRLRSGRRPAGPAGSAALGPGAAQWIDKEGSAIMGFWVYPS